MYVEAFVISGLARAVEPDYRTQCQFLENKACEDRYPRRHDDEPMHWTASSSGASFTFVELDHVFTISGGEPVTGSGTLLSAAATMAGLGSVR